jgi:hypothetical protein
MLWFYESFFPVAWIFFLLYWQIKATNTKATQRLESAASRILRVFIFLIAMRCQFGEAYATYARHTAALVPYLL